VSVAQLVEQIEQKAHVLRNWLITQGKNVKLSNRRENVFPLTPARQRVTLLRSQWLIGLVPFFKAPGAHPVHGGRPP
jgi:hypothetical protein